MDPDLTATFEAAAQRSDQLAQRLGSLTATGRDDGELVTATCASGGRLTDLQLDPKVRRLETHELREAILQAAGRASDEAEQALQSAIADFSTTSGTAAPGKGVLAELEKHMADAQKLLKEQTERIAALRDQARP